MFFGQKKKRGFFTKLRFGCFAMCKLTTNCYIRCIDNETPSSLPVLRESLQKNFQLTKKRDIHQPHHLMMRKLSSTPRRGRATAPLWRLPKTWVRDSLDLKVVEMTRCVFLQGSCCHHFKNGGSFWKINLT